MCVVVLGDVGRSPRMQYHSRSLIRHGVAVDMVGYADNPCVEELRSSPLLTLWALSRFPSSKRSIFLAPLKAAWMFFSLFWTLMFSVPRPSLILLQNPPSIPTLVVCWVVAWLRSTKLVIDWHNFGFTILAMSVRNKAIVKAAKIYEKFFGRLAHGHLCVSGAMQSELKHNWGIHANVLHDCPPEFFAVATAQQKKQLLAKKPLLGVVNESDWIVVTSTSFTADEKLDMLLEAALRFDAALGKAKKQHRVVFVVTGKGDMREQFEKKASLLKLKHCTIFTTYFESFVDYATMLGSADVGLSFHASSSGFDLPMKVVDMFGCGLPVCSISYPCIGELVKPGVNGLIFHDASELSDQLMQLLVLQPESLVKFRSGVKMEKWDANWNQQCFPILSHLSATVAAKRKPASRN